MKNNVSPRKLNTVGFSLAAEDMLFVVVDDDNVELDPEAELPETAGCEKFEKGVIIAEGKFVGESS